MKITTRQITTGLLALAGVFLASQPARAVNRASYAAGDLLLGFTQTDQYGSLAASSDLEVDIGNVLNYIPTAYGGNWNGSTLSSTNGGINLGVVLGSGSTVTSLNSDLTAVFGSSWNSNVFPGTLVKWGVAGFSSAGDNTDYLTQARSILSVLSAAPGAAFANSAANSQIASAATGLQGFSNAIQTASVTSSKALIQSTSLSNSWYSRLGSGNDFTGGYNILQTGSYGPTNSLEDFYKLTPDSNNNNASTYLGSFSLSPTGVLIYQSVPEPSTFAAFGVGSAFLLTFRPRRQRRS